MEKRKWALLGAALVAVAVIGTIAGIGMRGRPNEHSQLAAGGGSQSEPPGKTGTGTLRIWVPGGAIGDDYWVYVNGRIVSEPSGRAGGEHSDSWRIYPGSGSNRELDFAPPEFNGDNTNDLVVRDGHFNGLIGYVQRNIDEKAGDSKHLFYPADVELPPGEYNVEVIYSSMQRGSFPFAITPKEVMEVEAGRKAEVFAGIPRDWTNQEEPTAAAVADPCTYITGGKQDVQDLVNTMERYARDPMVRALRADSVSLPSAGRDTIVLHLPAEQGGTRQFDRAQIARIAGAIIVQYRVQSPESVLSCKTYHPEFAQSYDAYAGMLSDFEDQLQMFRLLAEN